MSLDHYLTVKNISTSDFAEKLNISSEAVRLYRLNKRIPRPDIMQKITEFTGGAVTANLFYEARGNVSESENV